MHELKVAHKVCDACGYYDGKQVVEVPQNNAVTVTDSATDFCRWLFAL